MSVFGITTNFGFSLINFASQTWHEDEYANWRKLDSLLTGIASNTPFTKTDTGAVNAYVIALTPAITAYTDGLILAFVPANTNTGASTINVNGLGVKNIQFQGAALVAGNLLAGGYVKLAYNGNHFEVLEPKLITLAIADGSIAPVKLSTGAMSWNASGDITAVRDVVATRNAIASDVKSSTNQIFFRQASNTFTSAAITYSTAAPSGGNDGDLWFTYT